MKKIELKVQKRKVLGRKVKKLRREGILPANIYGKKIKSQALQVPFADFKKVFQEVGETGVVYLTLNESKKEKPVLIHNVQFDPVSDTILHADFHQVSLKEKVTAGVPVVIIGEAPAKNKGLVLLTLLDEIEVEALPGDLPDKFEIDVSKLEEVDQGIALRDLKFDRSKVKPLVESEEELIVKVSEPTPEEEEEAKPEEKPEEEEVAAEEEAAEPEKGEKKEEVKEEKPEEAKPTSAKAPEGRPEGREQPEGKPEKRKNRRKKEK